MYWHLFIPLKHCHNQGNEHINFPQVFSCLQVLPPNQYTPLICCYFTLTVSFFLINVYLRIHKNEFMRKHDVLLGQSKVFPLRWKSFLVMKSTGEIDLVDSEEVSELCLLPLHSFLPSVPTYGHRCIWWLKSSAERGSGEELKPSKRWWGCGETKTLARCW